MSLTNVPSSDDDSSGDSNSSNSGGSKKSISGLNSSMDLPDNQNHLENTSERIPFLNPIQLAKIEEARYVAIAQLDLAFAMLKIMRQRKLTLSPVGYKCLIDACGRCGDSGRATDLLKRMHSDGIVADGTVYSCLVAAFSTGSTWRKAIGKVELPGENYF